MMERDALTKVVNSMSDWRLALMAKITKETQVDPEKFAGVIPIIAQYDANQETNTSVESLAELLDIKEKDVPHLYLLDL